MTTKYCKGCKSNCDLNDFGLKSNGENIKLVYIVERETLSEGFVLNDIAPNDIVKLCRLSRLSSPVILKILNKPLLN